MRILLLAPHPFYQERGTPIAVDLLLAALAARGDRVDVLTYAEGGERRYGPRVAVHRIPPTPFTRGIRPGFSARKLLCDAQMAPRALRLARETRPDIVHAVEESAFIARAIRRRLGIPYLFDMDSSMPRQIADKLPPARPLLPLMLACERRAVRDALAVVAMCDAIARHAAAQGAAKTFVLHDVSLLARAAEGGSADLRAELGIAGPLVLYLGNLERYQGIDLLLRAFALAAAAHPDAHLVVAGGVPAHVAQYRALAGRLGLQARVHFVGPRPLGQMGALFAQADILVSPRTRGGNTPMKIYSYMDAGKPLLATRLPTHTQVLDDRVALLADPAPEPFAAGLARLLGDAGLRADIAAAARALARERYSLDVFNRAVNDLYAWVEEALRGRPECHKGRRTET